MQPEDSGGPRILLIDDDPDSSLLVTRMLNLHGFHATTVNDSTQSLRAVEDQHPDLVLLDLIMPKISGTEVLESLRKKFSPFELPVVMLTAMDDSSIIAGCLKLGANDYISKPIDSEVAIARIFTQLELSRLYRESLAKKELETLNAMIVTYNHEINNPLGAAMLTLPSDAKNVSQESLDETRASLRKIASIVSKIEHVARKPIRTGQYSESARMIQL